MKFEPGQRVAYYDVTWSDVSEVPVGTILVDRPRGKGTSWDIFNGRTGELRSMGGVRLGFAVVNAECKPIPEPKLQAKLDALKAERGAA